MERSVIDLLSELSDESKNKLYNALKDFDFDGRCEFWRNQSCDNEVLYKIYKTFEKKDYKKAKELLSNLCTEYYRCGFARGCRAGFDDLSILLKLEDATLISPDCCSRMRNSIPRYKEKDQRVKEWRRKYKKHPDQAPFAASANIRQK